MSYRTKTQKLKFCTPMCHRATGDATAIDIRPLLKFIFILFC